MSAFPEVFRTWWDLPNAFAKAMAPFAPGEDQVSAPDWSDARAHHDDWLPYIARVSSLHRMTVIAAALATIRRATGAFPRDASALCADPAIAPGPDRADLVYTRFSADHCSITFDAVHGGPFTRWLVAELIDGWEDFGFEGPTIFQVTEHKVEFAFTAGAPGAGGGTARPGTGPHARF
jgi:hypothetical protein